jgi:hypothetical protein
MKTNIQFLIISHSFLLRMRNVSDKRCRENQNTHFVLINFFLKNRPIYDILWKNITEWGRPQMTIWHMSIACWIPKATKHTHRICKTHCFSTATIVAQTCLNATLYIHCLSCYTYIEHSISMVPKASIVLLNKHFIFQQGAALVC